MGLNVRWEVLDNYAVKLLTSGFSLEHTRRILLSGIRGYEAKVKRREDEMAPLYRTADESGVTRAKKKLLGKSTWFKSGGGGKGTRPTDTGTASRTRSGKAENAEGGTGPLETRSVIFVEHTPDGTLAKRLREQVGRMEHILGFRLKVVEKTGTKLKDT